MTNPTYETSVAAQAIIAAIQDPTIRSVVKYVSYKQVVKVTRRHKPRQYARVNHAEFVVTIGRPNHDERKFVKLCLKAGEPFPVKKAQIKRYKEDELKSRHSLIERSRLMY